MEDLPDELRPETEAESARRKRTMWAGIGAPTLVGGVLAVLLGVPWWIVLIFCALVAVGIFAGS